jgi:hypothetical protein
MNKLIPRLVSLTLKSAASLAQQTRARQLTEAQQQTEFLRGIYTAVTGQSVATVPGRTASQAIGPRSGTPYIDLARFASSGQVVN